MKTLIPRLIVLIKAWIAAIDKFRKEYHFELLLELVKAIGRLIVKIALLLFFVSCAVSPDVVLGIVLSRIPILSEPHSSIELVNPTPTIVPQLNPAVPRCHRLDDPIERNTFYITTEHDNLSCIAKRANISLEVLLEANPKYYPNPDRILVDESLYIP